MRYCGWYSNRSCRARAAKTAARPAAPSAVVEVLSEFAQRAKAAWPRLIRTVYEADPLECPKCKAPMRVIALIDDPKVIRRILEHLGHWAPEAAERGPPTQAPDWPANTVIPLTYHAVPDIAWRGARCKACKPSTSRPTVASRQAGFWPFDVTRIADQPVARTAQG